ncbi:MAG: 3-dehydroquinate synthase [Rubrivivax sp.]
MVSKDGGAVLSRGGAQAPDRLNVATGTGSYDILIGTALLEDRASWAGLPESAQGVIVTNSVVSPLLAGRLQRGLAGRHARLSVVELPDGEAHKDWRTLQQIFDHLIEHECDRRTVLYALGGGVVGDITGFAAGCYMRGVPFVQVPTTLLAQVDSSVGGKTAINHPLGKNMIGLFNPPARVVCDLSVLETLPGREFAAGMAEVVKYGPIADAGFLAWIEANVQALLRRDAAAVAHAVRRSCEIKAQVVAADERESGLREILNFGHTFGHAIEAATGFGTWLHGEAVACGMGLASALSARLGQVSPEFVERLHALLGQFALPMRPPDLAPETWLELMRRDKKAQAGQIRFVVLRGVGEAVVRPVSDEIVADLIRAAA